MNMSKNTVEDDDEEADYVHDDDENYEKNE